MGMRRGVLRRESSLVGHETVSGSERFIGPLPTTGPWTALGLTRGWFLAILLLSVAAFTFIGGPVWRHVHDSHFWRIVVSYALIPLAVIVAFGRGWTTRIGQLAAAVGVLALLKLVATAAMLAVIEMAG